MKRYSPQTRRSFVALLVALPMVATIAATAPQAVDAQATISQVTVYRDRAEVVRTAEIELSAGPATIVFRDLPPEFSEGSLLVSTDADGIRIGMVETDWRVDPREEELEANLQREILALQDAEAEVDEETRISGSLRKYLERVLESSAKHEGSKVFESGGEPEVILAVYQIAQREMTALAGNDVLRRPRLRQLEDDRAAIQKKLNELQTAARVRHRDVRVALEIEQSGPFRLELSYVVSGASWKPAYRAELDSDGEVIQFVTEAVVGQSTGEDWNDVQLLLSSATPSSNISPPQIDSWWLRAAAENKELAPPARLASNVDPLTGQHMSRVNPNSIEKMEVITAGAGVEFSRAQGGFARITMEPSSSGYTVTFEVPGRVQLAADGRRRRVTLRSETLEVQPIYRAVPSVDQRVFLVANTQAPTDYPLLAGPVRVFSGSAYLGRASLPETAPGAKLSLPFGVDNRIELTYVPSRFESRDGRAGKQHTVSRSSRTLINNLHDRTITLIVEARVPVAQDERIEVQLTRESTQGHTESNHRPGVLLWELELEPGENRELVLGYDVRHPASLVLQASR